MIDAQDWEGCPNKTECIEGNRFGKGCVEDAVQSAMGGKPWHECRCGVDCNGNPPNARQAAENEKLRAALELYREAVRIDATMEGPKFMGSNASALKRAWEADLVALGGKDE